MGVKDLWTILGPFCERKPLFELQGKKVAVDLSCWVCESQNIAEYTVQPRMYLRNLYFRTCYLLLMDVQVVFVLEGRAPELKYKTIAARNAQQFKGQKPKTDGVKTGKDRSRFNHTLKQCEEMLRLMGIACVKGEGEAEALCAHLNADGLVDGIISQDSDCFAYGGRVVYKNFSISQQGHQAAKGGSVDVYNMAEVEEKLKFGRNKVVALALLCGSDYSEGVHGIGKDSVMKLFELVEDRNVLDRLRSWKKPDLYQKLEEKISDKNVCTSCGHGGKIQSHTKKGCVQCGTHQGCDSKFKTERLSIKNELNMRSKAIKDPDFPDEVLIEEFLRKTSKVSQLHLDWKKPDLSNFVKFTVKFLTWEEIYAFEKFFPVLTRWQLIHNPKDTLGVVAPKSIKKKRAPKGVASYEIIWEDKYNQFQDLIPLEQKNECKDWEKLWSTIEPQEIVQKVYPELVRDFEESKKPKSRKKKKSPLDEIDDLMKNVSITAPARKKKAKTLDDFLVKSSTPKKVPPNFLFDMDQSNFGDEDDLEVSALVDEIVNRQPPCLLPNQDLNNCSFFVDKLVENDLFEKTFGEYCSSDSNTE